ncbi:MAG TPA: hypothetical protein VLA48_08720 [Nitrososphaeraceae archaeon]|nr:hypothetical protein [Nitrososphaeraceae archaeon]
MSISSDTTEDIIQILRNLQPFLRKPIIKNKMIDFFKRDNEFQSETINLILESLQNVNLDEYIDLLTTWLELLADFDNRQIIFLIQLYLEGLTKNPQLIKNLEPIIMNCIKNFNIEQKEKLRNCFLETLFLVPFDKNLLLNNLTKDTLNWLLKKEGM